MEEPSKLEEAVRRTTAVASAFAITACIMDVVQSFYSGKTFLQYHNPAMGDLQAYAIDALVIAGGAKAFQLLYRQREMERSYRSTDGSLDQDAINEMFDERFPPKKNHAKKVHQISDYR